MDMLLSSLEKKAYSLFQYFTRACCQIQSSFPMLPGAASVQPAVIIAIFLDGASLT
jgi:hypothetical protein